MDPITNPFVPGAGTPPPKLAGRDEILQRTEITLGRVKAGRNAKSFIVVGLRGVGKTVLLNEAHERAEKLGYISLQIEARENRNLPQLLIPKLRSALLKLDRMERASEYVKKGLRILAAFANSVKATIGDIEFGLAIEPEVGIADSGDLESDLADLMEAVGLAAKSKNTAVALVVDELQYLSENEMSALIMAMHRVSQRVLPVVLFGGGLPQLLGLAGRSKSYAERLFDYPRVGELSVADVTEAFAKPVIEAGADVDENAVLRVHEVTKGYPYFIQTWGHFAWNACASDRISAQDIDIATIASTKSLDESFFQVRLDRVTPAEKDYLFAMASLGPGPHRSGDVATELSRRVESVAPTRSSLIKKGMIYSPSHGDTAFTVPMFDTYLERVRQTE